MATYPIPIICPCGKHLGGAIKHSAGSKVCPACKKRVQFKESGGQVYTNYEKRN